MRIALLLAVALVACSKSKDEPRPATGAKSATAAKPSSPSTGITVKHTVPEFSGTYDRVLAQLSDPDHETVIVFVRGCPQLTCEADAWSPEDIAPICPKAFIATVHVPTLKPGGARVDMVFAGPVDHPSTATLERVDFELTAVDHETVAGTAHHETAETGLDGAFETKACPPHVTYT